MSSKKRTFKESFLNFGFTNIVSNGIEKPQCVVCFEVLSAESMKPSKLKRHLDTKHPNFKEKNREFFQQKADSIRRSRLDSTGSFQTYSTNIVKVSYEVAYEIAKAKKPHNIAEELIMPCTKIIVQSIFGKESLKKIENISLSNDTVHRRIVDLSYDILDQVIHEIKSSSYGFSLQVDESTDVTNMAQLIVCVRYVFNDNIKDEFLFCEPLEKTTTGKDVYGKVDQFFIDNGLDWLNVNGICTDGAPSMLGCHSGFQTLVKRKSPEAIGIHCMIHRQVLATKAMPDVLKEIMQVITGSVNYIRANSLRSRLFEKLCIDMDSKHKILLQHTEVRWLSKGKVLKRIFELRTEFMEFCIQQRNTELIAFFSDKEKMVCVAYLVDIFENLNFLNLSLQGTKATLLDFVEKLNAFQMKLKLWMQKVHQSNFYMFPTINTFIQEELQNEELNVNIKCCIATHLEKLETELVRYFPDLNKQFSNNMITLAKNPFIVNVDDLSDDFQEEFIELNNNNCSKAEFQSMNIHSFWIKQAALYPKISKSVLKLILPFPSTYLCEEAFSQLVLLKTKYRNKLDPKHEMRIVLSKTVPRIDVLSKRKEKQVSH